MAGALALMLFKGGVLCFISYARVAQFILSLGVRATRPPFEISNLKFQIPQASCPRRRLKLRKNLSNNFNPLLKTKRSWVCSAHEPRKCDEQAAFDSSDQPATDELASRGCREAHRRRSSGQRHLGAGWPPGLGPVLPGHPEQCGGRRAAGLRSAVVDQLVGVRLQPRDGLGPRSGAALRVRSSVPVANGAGGGELSHAGGFPRGKTEGV